MNVHEGQAGSLPHKGIGKDCFAVHLYKGAFVLLVPQLCLLSQLCPLCTQLCPE